MPQLHTDRSARTDAQQNRARILAVALTELIASPDVPLSVIAKKAGVGQATFYRHFPTREALVMGVYQHEMTQVAEFGSHLLRSLAPEQALREWIFRLSEYSITKAGLASAMRVVSFSPDCSARSSYVPVIEAAQKMLNANEDAGTIRTGVTTDLFFLAIAGIWQIHLSDGWEARRAWLVDFVMAGFRVGAPRTLAQTGNRPQISTSA